MRCRRQRPVVRFRRRSYVPAHLSRLTIALLAVRNRPPTSSLKWESSKRKPTKRCSGWSYSTNPSSFLRPSSQRSSSKRTSSSRSRSPRSKPRDAIAGLIPHSALRIPRSHELSALFHRPADFCRRDQHCHHARRRYCAFDTSYRAVSRDRAANNPGHNQLSGRERQSGVGNMLYMSSQSTSDGNMTLSITFKLGTNLDAAQVLVQNRVAIAIPVLPPDV